MDGFSCGLWYPSGRHRRTNYAGNTLEQEDFHIGAAPIGPKELARNSNYVFALPARYNYAFPTGYEEVEKILEGYPLQANKNIDM